jgi:uncharacterized MnhB-related membrane protein
MGFFPPRIIISLYSVLILFLQLTWQSIISGGAFSRLFEFQFLVFLAGTVSFTHAVAALIRCSALSTL